MGCNIFYSWQSDLDSSLNRNFILDALERAAKAVRSDNTMGVQPAIDRDTKNVAGSPDISETIFNKIAKADVFVCDVSFINFGQVIEEGKGPRLTPNPNVLIELGYAVRTLGWERVVLVMNKAFAPVGREIESLPFDIRQRRILTYNLPDKTLRAEERKKLQLVFDGIFRDLLRSREKGHSTLAQQIVEAADEELALVKTFRNPKGVAIQKLARVAIEEEGDFGAALKAVSSLIHLSSAAKEQGFYNGPRLGKDMVTASAPNALMKVLLMMSKADSGLFDSALSYCKRYALVGDEGFDALANYQNLPHKDFKIILDVLDCAIHSEELKEYSWTVQTLTRTLGTLLLSVSMAIQSHGEELPELEKDALFWGRGGNLKSIEGHPQCLAEFIHLSALICYLPQDLFDKVLERVKFWMWCPFEMDAKSDYSADDIKDKIKSVAMQQAGAFQVITYLKSEQDVNECTAFVEKLKKQGEQLAEDIKQRLLQGRQTLVLAEQERLARAAENKS